MAGYIGKGQSLTLVDGYTRAESDAIDTGTQQFNRIGSDGTIIDLHKDGGTVGSIGTIASDLTIGTGDSALRFNNPFGELIPHNVTTNSSTDASLTLGSAASRFKDLYLSGGVYLGGTGAANKLDDYEEGTWTPTLVAMRGFGTGVAIASYECRYTTIGDLVTLHGRITTNGSDGALAIGDYITIDGQPFAEESYGSSNIQYMGKFFGYSSLGGIANVEGVVVSEVANNRMWLYVTNLIGGAVAATSDLTFAISYTRAV